MPQELSNLLWSFARLAHPAPRLFDAVADSCVPMLAKPVWWIVRPAVRTLVLSAAGGALEQILALTRAAAPEPAA